MAGVILLLETVGRYDHPHTTRRQPQHATATDSHQPRRHRIPSIVLGIVLYYLGGIRIGTVLFAPIGIPVFVVGLALLHQELHGR